MKTIRDADEINLPPGLFACPICGAAVVLEGVDGWVEIDGRWQVDDTGLSITCETEPGLGDDGWDDWNDGHWNMPYVDWLPLTIRVTKWVNANYAWDMSEKCSP